MGCFSIGFVLFLVVPFSSFIVSSFTKKDAFICHVKTFVYKNSWSKFVLLYIFVTSCNLWILHIFILLLDIKSFVVQFFKPTTSYMH